MQLTKWEMEVLEPKKLYKNEEEQLQYQVEVPSCFEQYIQDKTYAGKMAYRTRVDVTKVAGKKYTLVFEGVSYYSEIYVNGKLLATHEGTWDAFRVDATDEVNDGENLIEVIVQKANYLKDDPFYFRSTLQGFVPDVAATFGGIFRPCFLIEDSGFVIQESGSEIDLETNIGKLSYTIASMENQQLEGKTLRVRIQVGNKSYEFREKVFTRSMHIFLEGVPLELWSTHTPALYHVTVDLLADDAVVATYTHKVGFRKIQIVGDSILLNGESLHIRGILHWGYYPETIAPIPTEAEIRTELEMIKELGFNMIKHCLYFPEKKFYEICDEMGILVWQEMPLWLPVGTEIERERIEQQYPRMLQQFIHHPSLILCSIGCELDDAIDGELLQSLYYLIKGTNGEIIVCDNSGSGEAYGGATESYSDIYDYHFYGELYNMESLIQDFTAPYRKPKPWFFGEFNDSDTFRDMKELEGVWWGGSEDAYNPLRITHRGFAEVPICEQEATFEQIKLSPKTRNALKDISLKKSMFLRKYNLEMTRRFPMIRGYNITTLRDVGITTSGIFDDNWEAKFTKEEMLAINSETALFITPKLSRKWHNGADKPHYIDMHNYSEADIVHWNIYYTNYAYSTTKFPEITTTIYSDGKELYQETFVTPETIEHGETAQLGVLHWKIPVTQKPQAYTVTVTMNDAAGTTNTWPFWSYPVLAQKEQAKYTAELLTNGHYMCGEVMVMQQLSDETRAHIAAGGKGIYLCPAGIEATQPMPFWREGIQVAIESHAILQSIGLTEDIDYQWLPLSTDYAWTPERLYKEFGSYVPIISRIDARSFLQHEYLVEVSIGSGTLLISTLTLGRGNGKQAHYTEDNILGKSFLEAMISYLEGKI